MNNETNTETTNTPKQQASREARLADKKAKLEAKLAETRTALKSERLKQKALEKATAKKHRARLLILGGLALADSIKSDETGKQATYFLTMFAKYQAKQEIKSAKQKAKLQEDQRLFAKFIELAKAGSI